MSRCAFCDRERNAGAREINPCSAGCGRWPCDDCADLEERCPECATTKFVDLHEDVRVLMRRCAEALVAAESVVKFFHCGDEWGENEHLQRAGQLIWQVEPDLAEFIGEQADFDPETEP